jgi:hypothetical protein
MLCPGTGKILGVGDFFNNQVRLMHTGILMPKGRKQHKVVGFKIQVSPTCCNDFDGIADASWQGENRGRSGMALPEGKNSVKSGSDSNGIKLRDNSFYYK